jgi:RNA polymerase sigma-70 factor (ECF subfamily)
MTDTEYNRCVDRLSDNVYRFVLKSLRDAETARDVVQESFLRLWENRQAVVAGKEKSYLFTVAYRLLIDQVRHRGRYTTDNALHHHGGEAPERHGDLDRVLSGALDTLSAQQRNLILLRDYEGYSYQEIGGMTGLSEAQVKVYIFRARTTLRQKIGPI